VRTAMRPIAPAPPSTIICIKVYSFDSTNIGKDAVLRGDASVPAPLHTSSALS